MAKKVKKEKLENAAKVWMQKIKRAKDVKDEWYKKFRIALAYAYLEGSQCPPGFNNNEWITINLMYANLRAILPTLYRTDPYFYVKLKKSYNINPLAIAQSEQIAESRQSFLNYLKTELNLKEKMRISIFDAHFQFGVIKVHHEADLMDNPKYGQPLLDEDGIPVYDDKGETLMEPEFLPANEAYRITRIHPNDIYFDEDCDTLEDDMSWVAQPIKAHVSDVQNDKRYNKQARENARPIESLDDINKERETRKKGGLLMDSGKKTPEICVKWEVWDLKNKEWMVIDEGSESFLINPTSTPPGIEGHPFVFLRFFPRDSSFYPIPPATQWLDPQREYCEARSKILIHRKRFNRKYEVYVEGLESEDELAKLETGADGTIIRKANNQGPAVFPIQDAPLDQSHWQEIMALRKDFDDVAVGPNQRGSATGVDSATEAGILEKRANIQEGDDIANVVDFATRIAEKLDMLVQTHITEDQAVKVTGQNGMESWQYIRATDYDDVTAEYQYSVNVGQMIPQLPEIERAQFTALLSLLISAPQLMMSQRLLKKIGEMYHMDDETLTEELRGIAQQMMSGQMPMPGQQGSQPGSPPSPLASIGAGMGINNMRGGQQ
jgi:hypothetical protein